MNQAKKGRPFFYSVVKKNKFETVLFLKNYTDNKKNVLLECLRLKKIHAASIYACVYADITAYTLIARLALV